MSNACMLIVSSVHILLFNVANIFILKASVQGPIHYYMIIVAVNSNMFSVGVGLHQCCPSSPVVVTFKINKNFRVDPYFPDENPLTTARMRLAVKYGVSESPVRTRNDFESMQIQLGPEVGDSRTTCLPAVFLIRYVCCFTRQPLFSVMCTDLFQPREELNVFSSLPPLASLDTLHIAFHTQSMLLTSHAAV